jgi:hypothetical protein
MGAPTPADGNSSHSRATSADHRPSLNTQQPDPNAHPIAKPAPKSVLKKRSADEHTALLESQRQAAALARQEEEGDYFGDLDDEDNYGESKSTWYMILLTLAIGGYVLYFHFNGLIRPLSIFNTPTLTPPAVSKSAGPSSSPTALPTCSVWVSASHSSLSSGSLAHSQEHWSNHMSAPNLTDAVRASASVVLS